MHLLQTNLRGKKILVTGGFGFIGQHLVKALVQQGAKVTIVSRRIPLERETAELARKVKTVLGDLNEEKVMEAALPAEIVFHLAATTPFQKDYSKEKIVQDQKIIELLINKCSQQRVRKIIFLSGHVVYGIPHQLPISETHTTHPLNLYGTSKLAAEKHLQQFCPRTGINFVIVRASSCYGPGQLSTGAIPNFMNAALENKVLSAPSQMVRRDYIFIKDLVAALLACTSPQVKNVVYNVGGGKSYDVKEVAQKIISLVGKGELTLHHKPENIENNQLDLSRIKKEVGFSPRTEFKEGLEKYQQWLEKKKNTPLFFLDLDGTLIDPFPRLYALHTALCSLFSIKALSPDKFITLKKNGKTDNHWLSQVLPPEEVRKYLTLKEESLETENYLRHDVLFPFTVPTLNKLRKKGLVIIITRRKNVEALHNQLKRLGVRELIDGALARGRSYKSKSHLLQENISLLSSNSYFVGDTEEDIRAGKELGIKTIAVTSGIRSAEFLQKFEPDFVVKDISEIHKLFKKNEDKREDDCSFRKKYSSVERIL